MAKQFLMATTRGLRQLVVRLPIYTVLFFIYFRQTAVQTLCGNISDPIRVNTDILFRTENLSTHKSVTNTVYILSIGFLATALIISVAVIIIILRRNKAKTKAALEQSNRAEGALPMQSTYDIITDPSPQDGTINTQDNVAYGHMQT